jgi:hypothetical protein
MKYPPRLSKPIANRPAPWRHRTASQRFRFRAAEDFLYG